jgi:Matrixin
MRIQSLLRPRRLLALGAIALAAVTTACGPIHSRATVGNSADYAINVYSGWVQRWNPCTPGIHYRVNTDMAPGQLGRVFSAVTSVSDATGLRFIYDGSTSYVPQQGSWDQPAELVIAFANHNGSAGGSTYLSGANQLGEGGFQSTYMTSNGSITSYEITKGYAVIDATAFNYSSDKVRNDTLLHELGHAVGLNHAHYTSEIMYPVISNFSPDGYTAGDLAGLAKVGASQGCT